MNRATGSKRLSIALICIDSETRTKLQGLAEAGVTFDVVSDTPQYPGSAQGRSPLQTVSSVPPDAVLIDFDRDRNTATEVASTLNRTYGDSTAIFAVSTKSDADAIITAMRSGCNEYLIRPLDTAKLVESFRLLQKKRAIDRTAPVGAQVVAVAGSKGGVGTTTLTTHLSTFLARANRQKVLLIDLHPDLGNCGTYMGFGNQGYSFSDVVANMHRLDADLIHGLVMRHESGAHVLVSRLRKEPAATMIAEDTEDTIAVLRGLYDVIVLDVPPGLANLSTLRLFTPESISLVVVPEVSSVRNLVCCLDHLSDLNYPPARIEIVVNRHSRRSAVSDEQIVSAARNPIKYRIPNNYSTVNQANNLGSPVPLNDRSDFAAVMSSWASDIASRSTSRSEPARAQKQGRTMFASILGL